MFLLIYFGGLIVALHGVSALCNVTILFPAIDLNMYMKSVQHRERPNHETWGYETL